MRVLLDECLPKQLARELGDHDVRTVTQMGWSGKKNGELLQLAAARFDVLITIDKFLQSEQTLPKGFSVITLRASSNRLDSLLPLVPELSRVLSSLRPDAWLSIGT